jgi:methylmalonyl-CoA mutase N-terminal domain/subunit
VNDPLGGSYYVESLTNELEKRIWGMIRDVEAMGDPAELSDGGWFRQLFTQAMSRYAHEVHEGTRKKVGLNVFQVPDQEDRLLREVSEAKIEPFRERVRAIRSFRENRDPKMVRRALQALFEAARDEDQNLMYPIVAASEAGATMGESAGVLREAYGSTYDPFGALKSPLASEPG